MSDHPWEPGGETGKEVASVVSVKIPRQNHLANEY